MKHTLSIVAVPGLASLLIGFGACHGPSAEERIDRLPELPMGIADTLDPRTHATKVPASYPAPEKASGPENLRLAAYLDNLANLYIKQHQYSKAEPLCRHALAIRESRLGAEHPSVAASLMTQAELCRGQRQYPQADALYARAELIQEKSLGPNHPSISNTLRKWAALLRQAHHKDEAIRLEARAEGILARPR